MAPDTAGLLTGVSVSYPGVEALVDVDLAVGVGERVALLGPSGSGKTTLLDVLAGLRTSDSGTVHVLGTQISTLTGRARRAHGRRVGTIGQQHDLALALRVIHNVNAGRLGEWSGAAALWSLLRPTGRNDVLDALVRVDLADRIDALTGDLSGGERQRVAVARVLRQQPELSLADEPTSSVDPELAEHVLTALVDAAPTTIVSLHDPALARRHASRVIGMQSGRVAFDRPVADVSDDDIVALYGSRSWT